MLEFLLRDFVLGLSLGQYLHQSLGLLIAHIFILFLGGFVEVLVQLIQPREGFVGSILVDFLLVLAEIEELRTQAKSEVLERLEVRLLIFLVLYLILLLFLLPLLLVYLPDPVCLVILIQFDEVFIDQMREILEDGLERKGLSG